MPLSVVILAAGQGKRMNSDLPKVLQPLAGQPLLQHVIRTARALNPANIYVVYGHGGAQVQAALNHEDVDWVLQAEQLGTGHAVMQAMALDPRRSHRAGAVRRCAADQRRLAQEVDRHRGRGRARIALRQSRRSRGLRPHRARRRGPRERHRRAQGCQHRRSSRSARQTPDSWRRPRAGCANGCSAWAGTMRSASTTSPTWSRWPWPRSSAWTRSSPRTPPRSWGSTTRSSSRKWRAVTGRSGRES